MLRRDPHHRAYAAIEVANKERAKTDDPKTKELVKVIGGTSSNSHLVYAWDKFSSTHSRIVLDSFLLADTTYDVIRRTTGVPIEVLQAYAEYIFDVAVFRDYLDRIDYVGHCRTYLPREEQAYYEAALTKGSDYIVWLMNGKVTTAPKAALEAVMVEGLFMGQAHRGADINSETAKQARAWLQLSSQNAANLQRLDPKDDEDALSELHLALTHDTKVINKDTPDAPAPDEIFH
jgi:hypothetical protein